MFYLLLLISVSQPWARLCSDPETENTRRRRSSMRHRSHERTGHRHASEEGVLEDTRENSQGGLPPATDPQDHVFADSVEAEGAVGRPWGRLLATSCVK